MSTVPEDLRGDGPCSRCGTQDNIVWFTDSVFWNHVVRVPESVYYEREPILCIPCFVILAHEIGYRPTGWRLSPEFKWTHVGNPSGSLA